MNIQPAATKTVTLTVYELSADLVEITGWGDEYASYALGRIYAKASGGGIEHRFEVQQADRVCVGDTITLDIPTPRKAGQ